MKVLIMSDNHGDEEVIKNILSKETYDIAIHCGDSELSKKFLDSHFDYWVVGNNDFGLKGPLEIHANIGGLNTFICHGHTIGVYVFTQYKPIEDFLKRNEAELIIHGHSHIYRYENISGVPVICPGSTSLPRGPEGKGYVIAEISNKKINSLEFVEIQ